MKSNDSNTSSIGSNLSRINLSIFTILISIPALETSVAGIPKVDCVSFQAAASSFIRPLQVSTVLCALRVRSAFKKGKHECAEVLILPK